MRGNLSYEGIGAKYATFKAGAGIKALVAAADRDVVVNIPVVVTDNNTVDLGTAGDVPFGVIDVYENDGHCSVQFRGFREDVPVVDAGITPGRVCLLDGTGKLKDSEDGIGTKQSMTKSVTTKASTGGTVIVTIKAAGSVELASGKAITVTVDTTSTDSNAASIRAALNADTDITAYFTVGGTASAVSLTRKVAAANETETFTFALGTAVACAMGATTDVAGVADRKISLPTFINTDAAVKTATIFLG